ncbi:MAG: hypothetical protein AB7Q29_12320 [Vicinamibacterales bacterium]
MSPKERLFPEPPHDPDDTRKPFEQFEDLASKILRVPKAEIDKREQEWQRGRDKQ